MKKMMMIGIYGLVILGISGGGTWYMLQKKEAERVAEENKPDPPPVSAEDLDVAVDITAPAPPKVNRELPVATRTGPLSVEEIVTYGMDLKSREELIRKREDALDRTSQQHRLVLAEIRGEQLEMEGLVKQARNQRQAAEKLIGDAQTEREKSEAQLKELADIKKKMDIERDRAKKNPKAAGSVGELKVDREANLKKLVSVMASVEPDSAANILKGLANDGRSDEVVEILATLEPRTASEILVAMEANDSNLAFEITAKFMDRKTPTKL